MTEPPMTDTGGEARDVLSMLLLCGELDGKRDDETPAQYLRRLIDEVIILSRRLAEAQGVIERQAKAMKDLVDLAERLSPYALSPAARQIIAAADNLALAANGLLADHITKSE